MVDGWLIYDFQGNNKAAKEVLGLTAKQHLSRRLFYWKPKGGLPIKLVHSIENHTLDHLPGETWIYASYQELRSQLHRLLEKAHVIAMEVSETIPAISWVDAGTVDLIRSLGKTVVTSAELLLQAIPPLSQAQQRSHCEAAQILDETVGRAWHYIRDHVETGSHITEIDVQEFIVGEFAARGCVSAHSPICAVAEHAANPHHVPTDRPIKKGDFVLIDLWAKLGGQVDAIYADIAKVAVAAKEATPRQQEIFQIVARARQAALELLQTGRPLQGWEVDTAARQVIQDAGYGKFFTHRLGHNIGQEVHGTGTHLDNFETHDTRPLGKAICFSVEPGIYLPGEFGVRLECDVFIDAEGNIEITGNPQQAIESLIR